MLAVNIFDDEKNLKFLSDKSEHKENRKETGSYYTPSDLSDYLVANSFYHYVNSNDNNIYSYKNASDLLSESIKDTKNLIFNVSVFDPTAGAGEMLLSSLKFKLDLLKNNQNEITDSDVLSICSTIFGNDYDKNAVSTMKERICIFIRRYINNLETIKDIRKILNRNITCKDYIKNVYKNNKQFDIIVGNPPYVEDNKYEGKLSEKYGNIYCNVISSCFNNCNNGVISLIIPISYISTPRMKKIRNEIKEHACTQIILNYSDRPDCLFTNVHQKLCVVLFKQNNKHNIFTSGYKYWNNSERNVLFDNISTYNNKHIYDDYIPKLGNKIDNNIFMKVLSNKNDFYNIQKSGKNDFSLYLNMRAAFWIKCFTSSAKSNEYKEYKFDKEIRDFVYCVLNSSLFFWYWITISDCWHITKKELGNFKFDVKINNYEDFSILAKNLELELEKSKEYIGSKQTEYEYKHKLCKSTIDEIDKKLASVYNLSDDELIYIMNYNLKYRMSDKNA